MRIVDATDIVTLQSELVDFFQSVSIAGTRISNKKNCRKPPSTDGIWSSTNNIMVAMALESEVAGV